MLIDFGLAKQVNDVRQLVFDQVGTAAYHAPEVGSPDGYRLDKADVWSLGVVLFTVCHGKYPMRTNDKCKRFAWFVQHASLACGRLRSGGFLGAGRAPYSATHRGSIRSLMAFNDPRFGG